MLIIGNGPSVLDEPLGALIDTFGTVVRLNQFSTAEREYTGIKTDVWATRVVSKVARLRYVNWNQRPQILINQPVEKLPLSKLRALASKYKCVCSQVTKEFHNTIQQEVKRRGTPGIAASSGLVIVAYYLQVVKALWVYVHGFDHLVNHGKLHYFDNRIYPKRKLIHIEAVERSFFDEWEQEGRIIRLCNLGKSGK